MWSLHNIGNVEAMNALSRMIPVLKNDLKNPDPERQETAVELLQLIGTPEAKAALNSHKLGL